jgi:hypothetical protein
VTLTHAEIEGYWMQEGGPRESANVAAAVALAESSGDPARINDDPSTQDYSVGLWQINYYGNLSASRTAQFGPPDSLTDPLRNAAAAVQISRQGQDFTPWTQYRNGAYKQYLAGDLPTAPAAVKLVPPIRRQAGGVPPKATLAAERAYAQGGSTLGATAHAPNTWNLFWGQVGYWLPDALNRSRHGRIAMRALRMR